MQLELKGIVHRCDRCHRELRSPESITNRMGKKCERITQAEIRKRGLCGKALGVIAGAKNIT